MKELNPNADKTSLHTFYKNVTYWLVLLNAHADPCVSVKSIICGICRKNKTQICIGLTLQFIGLNKYYCRWLLDG